MGINKAWILRNVLAFHFSDEFKRKRIIDKFTPAIRRSRDLASDLKILKAVLQEDAVDYVAGTNSEYQLTKSRYVLESYSSQMAQARQELKKQQCRESAKEEPKPKLPRVRRSVIKPYKEISASVNP